jgi:hypothetical protein
MTREEGGGKREEERGREGGREGEKDSIAEFVASIRSVNHKNYQ